MNLYNTDNNINFTPLILKLRRINDAIYDSIIKKPDGYYCRIVCGETVYKADHQYGDNIIHNGLYMIYPLPSYEIQEYKLENFTPPKLLDGDSLITVDSLSSMNPYEFSIKVSIDRRYMSSKEYLQGKSILLEKRQDRNHNKSIQIKEIYNDTNNIIGGQNPTNLIISNDENYEQILLSKELSLAKELHPNEKYIWDAYKKHYVIQKNFEQEEYQTYDNNLGIRNVFRYIKESLNGSSLNTGNHWVELEIWSKGVNIAKNKGIIINSFTGDNANSYRLVDGDKNSNNFWSPGTEYCWIEIDLLQAYEIDEIIIWHFFQDGRTYKDVRLEGCVDKDKWHIIYDNESPYPETSSGKSHVLNSENISNNKLITVVNHENNFKIEDTTNKLLVTKQLINNYSISFKNSNSAVVKTENIVMKKQPNGIYYNIIDKPNGAVDGQFNITLNDSNDVDIPIVSENFRGVTTFDGRINIENILVSDPSARTYCISNINTNSSLDLFVKGGDILKIGCIQNLKSVASDGDVIIGTIDYSSKITPEGIYIRVDLTDIHPIRDINRVVVINTNSIGTATSNPCTELFIISNKINMNNNLMFNEVESLPEANEIIEVDYEKVKDHEEQYRDTLMINDWVINEAGEIEKKDDGKAYSAIVLCNAKDSFKVSGNVDLCRYVFLDADKNPITKARGPAPRIINDPITTSNAPNGTQYCIFYLNSEGLLKQEDFSLLIQSFSRSSEIDNYIKIEGNPIIGLSAPYKKIRPLPAPTNIKSVDMKTSLVITWDEVLGAEEYIVYLDDAILEIVKTNRLELFTELRGFVSIKAINDITQSPLSERVFIHSVPRNPFIIYIDNIFENNKYNFDVTFKDNSELETGYKVKYVIDDREEETITLSGQPGTGTMMKASFSALAINEKVKTRVLAVNEQGENEVAPYIELRMPPAIKWAYKEDTKQLTVSWVNTFPESEMYLLRYKEEGAEHYSTQTIINDYTSGSRITTYLPLAVDKKMTISLAATYREDIPHIFSKPIECSAANDINLVAPLDFKSTKVAENQIEFTWIDNHEVEDGWELATVLNNTENNTIYIPSSSVAMSGGRQRYVYTFEKFGFMDAKLRMKWSLGVSKYTETITNYYFEVDNVPPSNIQRIYEGNNRIKFYWEPQSYVKRYVISIKKKTDSKFETIYVESPEFYFENFEEVDYVYNIRTEFLGEMNSAPSKNFEFKPTVLNSLNKQLIVNAEINFPFKFEEKTIYSVADKYGLITRSITQNTRINYPIYMSSTTQFTMFKGLVTTDTWGVGQRTEGSNEMIISTRNNAFVNTPLNSVSYQETEFINTIRTTIVTKDSNSYKIEMEINKTRIVGFGDSITAGHPGYWAESGTGDIEHSYPYWLDRRLKFKYEVINKGYGSDRTYDLLKRIDKDVIALNPQYCLIQIGTNDIYWGAAGANGNLEAFEEVLNGMKNNMKVLVQKCFDNDIKPIIGMLIPRTQSVTDELVRYGLYSFNEWIIEYANTTPGLNYVDFFNAGKDAIPPTPLEDPNSPGAMNPIYDGDNIYDEMGNLVQYGAGIHLNREGYKIMAEAIPLNLFNDFTTGLKMYVDKECAIEAEYNIDDKQNPFYKITIEAMQLTRTKRIIRYVKNVGISQTLFAMYPTKVHNLKYTFQTDEMEVAEDMAYGILTPGKSVGIIMELTPQTEDSKSEFELSLVGREFNINS